MKKFGVFIMFSAMVIKIYMSWGFTGTIVLGFAFVVIGGLLGANNIEITFGRDDDDDDFWED